MRTEFGQIITAMVTPFDENGKVNHRAGEALLEYLFTHGSDGVVVCGTTGEAATLTDSEQVEFIATILTAARESFPDRTVIAGVGSNDTAHAVELTQRVCALGPDALLSVNPYYNRPGPRGIRAHFEAIDRASDLPIVLYNIPIRTGEDMSNELLAELAELEHVVAVKQANSAAAALVPGLTLYAGNDDLLSEVLSLGGAGGILTASHMFGPQMRRLVDEPTRRAEIDAELDDVYHRLPVAPWACVVKAAMRMLGIDLGRPRLPYVEPNSEQLDRIRTVLDSHQLLEGASA